MKKKIIAFIFMRESSTRLKNKNIKTFNKKPLFMNSIHQVKKVKLINDIFVSTDSLKIISICKKNNIKYIHRPKKLATKNSNEMLAWKHAISYVSNKFGNFDYFISLPATSPLRKTTDIKKIIRKCLKEKNNNIYLTVTKLKNNIINNLVVKKNNKISLLEDKIKTNNLKNNIFQINGSIYLLKKDLIKKIKKELSELNLSFIETSPLSSIDIDDINDFKLAKSLLKK